MESEKLNSATVPDGSTKSSITLTNENNINSQRSWDDLLLDKNSNISHNSHKPSKCKVHIPSDCLDKLMEKTDNQKSALLHIKAEMKTSIQVFRSKKDMKKAYLLIRGNDMESVIKTKRMIAQTLNEDTPKLHVPLRLHEVLANANTAEDLREVTGAEVTPIGIDDDGRSIIYQVTGNYNHSIKEQMKSISIATTALQNMINLFQCQESYDPSNAPNMSNEETSQPGHDQSLRDIVYIEDALPALDNDRHGQIASLGCFEWEKVLFIYLFAYLIVIVIVIFLNSFR